MVNSKSPKYELVATFVFECKDDIDKAQYKVHKEAKDEVLVDIERKIRRVPLVGMKQPTPHGAMLGWEGALLLKHKGKAASGYKWKLYRDNILDQEGRTDERSKDSLELELPDIEQPEYKLEIFAPIYQEDNSCNKVTEAIHEQDQHGNSSAPV
jgi:hypothetical protein